MPALCPLCGGAANGRGCRQAHALMFTAEERKEYGFGTFEEDLKATNDECYGKGEDIFLRRRLRCATAGAPGRGREG